MGTDYGHKISSKIGTIVRSVFGIVLFSDVPYSDVNCMYLTKFKFQFLRNGRWRSVWTVALSDDGREGEVSGALKVQVKHGLGGTFSKSKLNLARFVTFIKRVVGRLRVSLGE